MRLKTSRAVGVLAQAWRAARGELAACTRGRRRSTGNPREAIASKAQNALWITMLKDISNDKRTFARRAARPDLMPSHRLGSRNASPSDIRGILLEEVVRKCDLDIVEKKFARK